MGHLISNVKGGNKIRDRYLIIPGYIIGLTCLLIITYRTLIAFFSETKLITININRYGEQFLDIIAIVVLWSICLIGLFFLIKRAKHVEKSNEYQYNFSNKAKIMAYFSKAFDKKK